MKKNKYADLRIIDTYSVNLWEDGYIIRDGRPYQPDYTHLAEDPSGNRYAVKLKPWNGKISHALPVMYARDVLDSLAQDLIMGGYSLESWDDFCTDWVELDLDMFGHLQQCEVQYINHKLYEILNAEDIEQRFLEHLGYELSFTETDSPKRLIFRHTDDKNKVKVFESWQEADMYYESLSD